MRHVAIAIEMEIEPLLLRLNARQGLQLVEEGGQVSADTVIGLIEVMKQFSELTAGTAGRLSAFLVEDGDPVEPGQVIATLDDE
mgnify:CR=1 FL=1